MPALNEQDYASFNQMLEELEPEVENMKETPRNFMRDMVAKNKDYGERMFVSPKQLDWVRKLHEEYVGDTDHGAAMKPDGGSDRDEDSDIPF